MRILNRFIVFFVNIFLLQFNSVKAQENQPASTWFYLELAGSGGLGSLNVEKKFHSSARLDWNWRVGFSLAPIDKNNGVGLVFPLMVHMVYGKTAHKLDLGAGQGLTLTTKGNFFLLAPLSLGYRYQPSNKKLIFRIAYTPLISYIYNFQMQQWAGFSIGLQLKGKK